MRAVVTRVRNASVTIDGQVAGAIDHGFLVLLGVAPEDTMALQAASAIQQAAVLAPSAGLRAAALPSVDFNFNLSMEGILPTLDLFLENGFQVHSEKVEGEFESNGVTYHYQETIFYTDTSGKEKTAET